MKRLLTVLVLLMPASLWAGHHFLPIGSPVQAKVVSDEQAWEACNIDMTIDHEQVTGLSSGQNRLNLTDEQRDVLVEYLKLAYNWQTSGFIPDLSSRELFQICEGRSSVGAIGLMRCQGIPYVVIILGDDTQNLYSGMRLFLTKQAVSEMILKLDNAPLVYSELKKRIELNAPPPQERFNFGASFDSTSMRG